MRCVSHGAMLQCCDPSSHHSDPADGLSSAESPSGQQQRRLRHCPITRWDPARPLDLDDVKWLDQAREVSTLAAKTPLSDMASKPQVIVTNTLCGCVAGIEGPPTSQFFFRAPQWRTGTLADMVRVRSDWQSGSAITLLLPAASKPRPLRAQCLSAHAGPGLAAMSTRPRLVRHRLTTLS